MLMSARNPALTATLLCAFSLVTVHCADRYIGHNCTKTQYNQNVLEGRDDLHRYRGSIRKTMTDAKNFISDATWEEFQSDWDKNTYKLEEIRRKREARKAAQEEQPAHRYNAIRRKRKKPRSRNSVGNGLAEKQKQGGKKRGLPKAAGRTSAYGASTLNFVKGTRKLAQETQDELDHLSWQKYMRTIKDCRSNQLRLLQEQAANNARSERKKRRRRKDGSTKDGLVGEKQKGDKKHRLPKAAGSKKGRGVYQSCNEDLSHWQMQPGTTKAMKAIFEMYKKQQGADADDTASVYEKRKTMG